MASTQLREAYVALLMDRFNGIRYPSSPMMDRLEAAITDRESAEAYVAALLDHVEQDGYPSPSMLDRLNRLISAL